MYDQLEAQLHDLFWAAEGQNEELSLMENFLQQYPGTALELGCGSGRLLLPLMEKGFLIEGLDQSEEMLELCRQRSAATGPVLHLANMEGFETGSLYHAIAVPAFTLQLINAGKISAVLDHIHRHLHPGGGLYLTIFIPWAEITGELEEDCWFLDHEVETPEGHLARCYTRFKIRRISQLLTREHRYEIVDENNNCLEQSRSTQHLTWYWQREMALLLRNAGFTLEQTIGDFDASLPADDNCQILTMIARRNVGDADAT